MGGGRHKCGRCGGSIFLAEKEGGQEFTREDEDTLVLFASQAATAIANARRQREERRARGGLETPIDTHPWPSSTPRRGAASFNREARRIADALRDPDQTLVDLLNLVLPDTGGIELMQAILEIADVPVIFLSAYGREDTIARAFDMGAVDYVVKPFSPTELAARIGAALRRREVSEPLRPYVLGGLVIDYALRRVSVDGRPVQLTAMEYRTLAELSANAGRVLTYQHLLEKVWNEKSDGEKGDADMSPMRTMVAKLRGKLREDARNPRYIFTESRVGYWMPEGEIQGEGTSTEP